MSNKLKKKMRERRGLKMKFKLGDEVRTIKGYGYYATRFPIGTIGIITKIARDTECPYRVEANNDYWYYAEDELELVEYKEEKTEEKKPMKMRGKLGMMLKCERCEYEEFAEATNTDNAELVEDLEFGSAVMDRWGEISGLSLCPKCSDALNKFIDGFMSSSGNVEITYTDGSTETM